MRTKKQTTTFKSGSPTAPKYLTEGAVREIVDGMLREGFGEQARDLEQHLKSIHDRIVRLETRSGGA